MAEGFVGTYSQKNSKGIYKFVIDDLTGNLTSVDLFCEINNSRYITYKNNTLFALFDSSEGSGIIAYNDSGKCISKLIFEKTGSCFLIFKDTFFYTANYHEGTVSKIEYKNNTFTLAHTKCIKEKAGSHQVLLYDDKLLVPCLLLDTVYILNDKLDVIDTIAFPKGSGPRHGIFSLDKNYLFFLTELSNELYTFKKDGDVFTQIKSQKVNATLSGLQQAAAAIRLHHSGNTIFTSIRTSNIISTFDIQNITAPTYPIISSSCSGDHPRDILNILNDQFLLVANRDTNQLVSFKIVNQTEIKKVSAITIPECICICMAKQ